MTLNAQLRFLREVDHLKHVMRQTVLVDQSRKENTAEHSWHIALAAITLADYADEPIDVLRVVKMLLLHDIVEIDAGDTFAFDAAGHVDKFDREQQAAERIFGLLPDAQRDEFMGFWLEFEAKKTADAKFANAIDRLLPFLHNIWTEGQGSWEEHQPRFEQVYRRNEGGVGAISADLWDYTRNLMTQAVENGWLNGDHNEPHAL